MMKTKTVVLIALFAVAGFAILLVYGLWRARGAPVVVQPRVRATLDAPRLDKRMDLAAGVISEEWDGIPSTKVELNHQLTIMPWPKKRAQSVEVRAFHNAEDVFFRLAWKDDTEDRALAPAEFPDACAIMFPLGTNISEASILMGFLGKSSLWHWRANRDARFWEKVAISGSEAYSDRYYPFEDQETLSLSRNEPEQPVNDLLAIRVGTVTSKERQVVAGRGVWTNGEWRVVMKRALQPADADPETDAVFGTGMTSVCAFAVWKGESGDRGGRKSISDFVNLRLQ